MTSKNPDSIRLALNAARYDDSARLACAMDGGSSVTNLSNLCRPNSPRNRGGDIAARGHEGSLPYSFSFGLNALDWKSYLAADSIPVPLGERNNCEEPPWIWVKHMGVASCVDGKPKFHRYYSGVSFQEDFVGVAPV